MHGGRVLWDDANRRHITADHPERGISVDEVDQVLNDRRRRESRDPSRGSYVVIGRTARGRLLLVAYVLRGGDRYPIHARQGGAKAAKEYER